MRPGISDAISLVSMIAGGATKNLFVMIFRFLPSRKARLLPKLYVDGSGFNRPGDLEKTNTGVIDLEISTSRSTLGLEAEILWPLEKMETKDSFWSVSCDPVRKRHCFFLPENKEITEIQKMKFVAHAWLAEKVHHLFSAVVAECPDELPEKVFRKTLWPVLSVSRVWFADALFIKNSPEQGRNDIKARLAFLDETFPSGVIEGSISDFLEAALILAEGRVFCDIKRPCSGKMAEIVEAFLKVDPFDPSFAALKLLNNGLLAVWSPYRVDIAHNDELGMEVWKVF